MAQKRKTLSITEDRYLKLERAALETGNKIGKTVKWTDIANRLIDGYIRDVQDDIVMEMKAPTEK